MIVKDLLDLYVGYVCIYHTKKTGFYEKLYLGKKENVPEEYLNANVRFFSTEMHDFGVEDFGVETDYSFAALDIIIGN